MLRGNGRQEHKCRQTLSITKTRSRDYKAIVFEDINIHSIQRNSVKNCYEREKIKQIMMTTNKTMILDNPGNSSQLSWKRHREKFRMRTARTVLANRTTKSYHLSWCWCIFNPRKFLQHRRKRKTMTLRCLSNCSGKKIWIIHYHQWVCSHSPFQPSVLGYYPPTAHQDTSDPSEPMQFTQITQNEPQNKSGKFWCVKYQ